MTRSRQIVRGLTAALLAVVMMISLMGCLPFISGRDDGDGNNGTRNNGGDDTGVVEDIVAGTEWLNDSDESYMVFTEDGEFIWYQEKAVDDDNYYAGDYTCYMREEAQEFIVEEMPEYGITEDELDNTLSSFTDDELENFFCVAVHEDSFMRGGEEQRSEPVWKYYFGFVSSDGESLWLFNAQSANDMEFTRD